MRPAEVVDKRSRSSQSRFVDAHWAAQALIAALLVEYGRRARERTRLARFERLAARPGIFYTDT